VRKAREKLIDLSMRNSMLNFRHSETSARHVRIVDENLEFLVRTLASGESLDIIPLPPVEQIPRDEDTDAFRAALKAAKGTDPDWLAAEDARRAAGNRRRTKDSGRAGLLDNLVGEREQLCGNVEADASNRPRVNRIAGYLGVSSRLAHGEDGVGIEILDSSDVRASRGRRGRHAQERMCSESSEPLAGRLAAPAQRRHRV